MEIQLLKVSFEKLNKVTDFCKWPNEVRRYDELLHADREEYEQIVKDRRELSCCTNNFTEPLSCHIPK